MIDLTKEQEDFLGEILLHADALEDSLHKPGLGGAFVRTALGALEAIPGATPASREMLFEKARVAFEHWRTLQDALWAATWCSFLTGLPMPGGRQ